MHDTVVELYSWSLNVAVVYIYQRILSGSYTFSTWAFHVSFSSIVTPRYVTTSTCIIVIASVSISRRFSTNCLFWVWNKTKLVFYTYCQFIFYALATEFSSRHSIYQCVYVLFVQYQCCVLCKKSSDYI